MENVKNFTRISFWTVKLRQILGKTVHKLWQILWKKVRKSRQNQILQKKVHKLSQLWQIKERESQQILRKTYSIGRKKPYTLLDTRKRLPWLCPVFF